MPEEITKETVEQPISQSAVNWDNPKDVSFLKSMKAQGVAAPDAFSRLAKVKDDLKSPMAKHIEGLRGLGKSEEEINKIVSSGATIPDFKSSLQKGVEGVKKGFKDLTKAPEDRENAGGIEAGRLLDPTIGAVKGFARGTGATISSIGERGLRAITPEFGLDPERPTAGQQAREAEILQPKGKLQKTGEFLEGVGEFSAALGVVKPGLAGLSLFRRALAEGAVAGGVTVLKEGEVGKQAAISASIGTAFPFIGKGASAIVKKLFGQKALATAATGLTPTVTSQSDDIAQTVIKVGGKTKPAYESFDDFLVKEGFFKEGLKTDRIGMLKHAEQLFVAATKDKTALLSSIKEKIPVKQLPKLVPLLKKIIKAYDDDLTIDQFNRMSKLLSGIEKGSIKKLGAEVIDDIRFLADDILPRGAFSGAEPVKTKAIEQAIKPLRKFIAGLDTTGQIQHDNIVKRVLGTMLGFGKATNPMARAADSSGAFKVLTDVGIGAAAGGGLVAASIPGGQAVAAPLVLGGIAKAIADQPPVASALINSITKIAGNEVASAIVKKLPLFLESALLAASSEITDEER